MAKTLWVCLLLSGRTTSQSPSPFWVKSTGIQVLKGYDLGGRAPVPVGLRHEEFCLYLLRHTHRIHIV